MKFKDLGIKENFPLKRFTTFRIGGPARYYIEVTAADRLADLFVFIKEKKLDFFVLGGGSNVLISDKGIDGLVINLAIKGIEKIKEDDRYTWIKVGSGEVWDEIVAWAVNNNLWGIENLSLIPGRLGGFVMQNVGAYGQEASQTVAAVTVFDTHDSSIKKLKPADCQFAYRQSIFNTQKRGRYLILSVELCLNKSGQPNLSYPDVEKYFSTARLDPTLVDMRSAIIAIRKRKLPPIESVGSAGSFFKNVVVTGDAYRRLENKIANYFGKEKAEELRQVKWVNSQTGDVKIPTAFIIDKLLEAKGKRVGGAKIYDQQALVIVNDNDQATADDVMSLFKQVRQLVYSRTGLTLEPEPNLLGFTKEELDNYFRL